MAGETVAPAGSRAATEAGAQQSISHATLVEKICSLMSAKGPGVVAQVEQKIANGQGITVKGVHMSVDVLREALNRHRTSAAVAAPSAPTPQAAETKPAPMANRWQPTASDGAVFDKVLHECENAQPFAERVAVKDSRPVAIFPRPNVLAKPTGQYLEPSEHVKVIARVVMPRDGRVYLRLKDKNGWVPTRARDKFERVVLSLSSGAALQEPAELSRSLAAPVLRRVDERGRPVQLAGGAAAPSKLEPRQFRALGAVHVLGQANVAAAPSGGARIPSGEHFWADGALMNPQDGRVYLRLKDGRGWVSERARTDFTKFAVEPSEGGFGPADVSDDEPLATGAAGGAGAARKGVVVMSRPTGQPAQPSAEAAQLRPKPVDRPAIFRSDTDLWPKEMQPPRPLAPEARRQLRRLSEAFGAKARQCESDVKEIMDRIAAYKRACDAQKELQQYAEVLRKEAAKFQREWADAVRERMGADVSAADAGKTDSAEASAGLGAALLRGTKCFFAELHAPPTGEAVVSSRLLGPIRPSVAAASQDLEKMRQRLRPDSEQKDAARAAAESGESPPLKRLRRCADTGSLTAAAAAGG